MNAPFILLLPPFGIRFQTTSVTYIRFLSSKSNLKLIFFVRLFWIHRCNLFVFIVCALWVLLKILRLIRRRKIPSIIIIKKRRENCKREGRKWKMEGGKVTEWREDPFAFNFSKPLKFVLGLPIWKFSTGKKAFHAGKKNQEKWLCPLRKFFLLCPWPCMATLVLKWGLSGREQMSLM